MIEKFSDVGAGSIVGGFGGAVNYQNGAVIARAGVGLYTLTLDTPVSCNASTIRGTVFSGQAFALCSFMNFAADKLVWNAVPDVTGTIWTFSLFAASSGVPADPTGTLGLMILAFGTPGQGGI